MCQPHYEQLKQAIRDRGLWPLVAQSPEAASANIEAQVNGDQDPKNYDPLLNATMMIYHQGVKQGGLYMMTGDYCPLCELEAHTTWGKAAEWISGCTDAVLEYCRTHKLVPATQ